MPPPKMNLIKIPVEIEPTNVLKTTPPQVTTEKDKK
jgi:hypothetical protein